MTSAIWVRTVVRYDFLMSHNYVRKAFAQRTFFGTVCAIFSLGESYADSN